MQPGNETFLLAAVVIFAIMAAVVMYAIKKLAAHPVRVAAVISAFAALVAVMPQVIGSLSPPAAPADLGPLPSISAHASSPSCTTLPSTAMPLASGGTQHGCAPATDGGGGQG
jgi:hypothetical protein